MYMYIHLIGYIIRHYSFKLDYFNVNCTYYIQQCFDLVLLFLSVVSVITDCIRGPI